MGFCKELLSFTFKKPQQYENDYKHFVNTAFEFFEKAMKCKIFDILILIFAVWPLIPPGFKISHLPYYITVEPMGFLVYTGLTFFANAQPVLQQLRFTEEYQVKNDFRGVFLPAWSQLRLNPLLVLARCRCQLVL